MRYIKHLVRRYPMQSFLILFNAGGIYLVANNGNHDCLPFGFIR